MFDSVTRNQLCRAAALIGTGAVLFLILAGTSTVSDVSGARALMDLEAAEISANQEFSRTVPEGMTTNDALLMAQEAASAGLEEAHKLGRQAGVNSFRDSEAAMAAYQRGQTLMRSWQRWAAHNGNSIAAVALADNYWSFADDSTLSEGGRSAYRALSCKWYRRAAEEDNYARVVARDKGCDWVKRTTARHRL